MTSQSGGAPERLLADWTSNRGCKRVQLYLLTFRIAQALRAQPFPMRMLGRIVGRLGTLAAQSILAIDLPVNTRVGAGLTIYHGYGLVVNGGTRIGSNVTLRQNTTIGSRRTSSDCPTIGDYVDIGANVVVIGDIRIGSYSRIGAGSVVLADVMDSTTVAGNPARTVQSSCAEEGGQ